MKFPWQRRTEEAANDAAKAKHEYEWAVQNRTTVSAIVSKIRYHGDQNGLIEKLNLVTRGGHK